MPYGIPKSSGGDSPTNVDRVERCVKRLQAKGYSKVSSIKLCKASMFGRKKG